MTPKDKNIPQTLCEFHSIFPNAGERKPNYSLEHPGSGLNFSVVNLYKGLPTLVLLEAIFGCLQVMKLFRKEAFKGVTCLGHETTKIRV